MCGVRKQRGRATRRSRHGRSTLPRHSRSALIWEGTGRERRENPLFCLELKESRERPKREIGGRSGRSLSLWQGTRGGASIWSGPGGGGKGARPQGGGGGQARARKQRQMHTAGRSLTATA